MLTYSVEESVDASAEDILDFLAREVQYIHPDKVQIKQPERIERTVNFYGERKGNNSHIVLKFYKIWSRVGIAFGASFARNALRKIHDLE
jgi:hypothetical protein